MYIPEANMLVFVVCDNIKEAMSVYELFSEFENKTDVIAEQLEMGYAYIPSLEVSKHTVIAEYENLPDGFAENLLTVLQDEKYEPQGFKEGLVVFDFWTDRESDADKLAQVYDDLCEVWGVELVDDQVEVYYDRGAEGPKDDNWAYAKAEFICEETTLLSGILEYMKTYLAGIK